MPDDEFPGSDGRCAGCAIGSHFHHLGELPDHCTCCGAPVADWSANPDLAEAQERARQARDRA